MRGTIFFVCSTLWISRCSLTASSSNFLSDPTRKQSAMSKGGQEATSSEDSSMAKPKPMTPAKARPMNLVLHNPLSATRNHPQDLGDPVNPENVDEERGGRSSSGKPVRTNPSQDPIEYSQVRREETLNMQTPGHRGETCAGGEHKDRCSEHEDRKPSIHDEGFPIFAKEVGNHNRLLHIINGSTKDQCFDMEIVHFFVNESSHSSWTKLFRKIWKCLCGEYKRKRTKVPRLHDDLITRDTRPNHTTTGLALWSSLTLETRSHPRVPAGHPQYTGAWFVRKAVDGPIPPQRTRKPLRTLTW